MRQRCEHTSLLPTVVTRLAKPRFRASPQKAGTLPPTSGFVRILRQIAQQLKERRRLADEASHGGQEIREAHGNAVCLSGTNDGAWRKLPAEEWGRVRNNQVGFKILAAERWGIQVWKSNGYTGHRIDGRQRGGITCLVRPRLKVHRLNGANADQDSQNFQMSGPQCHRGIEAVATLIDGRELENCGIRDRLKEFRILCVVISPGNRRILPNR